MTSIITPPEGGCTCGHVRYQLTSDPLIVHCCHCSWCQRQTGSAFAINALFVAEHGSWNRSSKVGYDILLVTLDTTRVDYVSCYNPSRADLTRGSARGA